VVKRLLNNCRVYQFHDTSITSGIRNPRYVDDNRYLRPDASNLAAFLHRLQRDYADSYSRIRKTVQQVLPFFDDFDLDPIAVGGDKVRLNWQERDSDHLFGPHQLSDGSLRAMALIALLLQPFESLPTLLVLDEPELGLHPAAINIVSALMKQAALHCQLLIATQSTALLDEFDPTQVTVVERDEVTKSTTFERLDPNKYTDWLDKYTLHELWERNVIGGGPF
jgi:predicted ATPase